jgi:HK97 family phage major capsid protein
MDRHEMLVYMGDTVKALSENRVGGYLVRFTTTKDPDLMGDFFTASTDFDIADGDARTVYYHHGFDGTLKNRKLGKGVMKIDDVGIWVEAQLELRDEYEKQIYELVQAGKLGWSSGAVGHLVEAEAVGKAYWLKTWPIGEASLTPTPAEPRNEALPIKSLFPGDEAPVGQAATDQPETGPEASSDAASVDEAETAKSHVVVMTTEEDDPMADNEQLDALKAQVDGLSESVNKVLELIQNEPAHTKAGYFTNDGGKADENVKSFADFLLAVYRGDEQRLKSVYQATKDLGTTDGSSGGFLVPQEFSTQLLKVAEQQSQVLARVQTVSVGAASGTYPALDQYTAPTAGVGQTALAAGVRARSRAEGASPTETEPAFSELQWRVKQVGGYTEVNNELVRYSPQAVETLLRQLFGIAIAAKQEHMILRGNGSTEYLGILNAPATVTVTADTAGEFDYPDMLEMWSRFKRIAGDPVFLAHPELIPDIGQFEIGTNGAGVPAGVGAPGGVVTMPGTPYPIVYSEHLPQADNNGCVILADLGSYLVFQNGALEIAFSEHAAFTTNKGTWRFLNYSDGMPWMKSTITLADPQGSYTVSPFVALNNS